jgi:hypothetical protein
VPAAASTVRARPAVAESRIGWAAEQPVAEVVRALDVGSGLTADVANDAADLILLEMDLGCSPMGSPRADGSLPTRSSTC